VDIEVEVDLRLNAALAPNQIGQVLARRVGDLGWQFHAVRRSDLSEAEVCEFAQWVRTSVDQLLESNDPVGNGWFPRSDEADLFQMTATSRAMPPDPFA
jgi:hypothetical protein